MIEITASVDTWDGWRRAVGLDDIYYDLRYLRVWQTWERGEALGARFTHPLGEVLYPFLRVPLDVLTGGAGAVDLRTAYDFGGPLAFGERPAELLAAFEEAWSEEARSWGVVSEFRRLHPFRCPHRPADARLHAENFVMALSGSAEDVEARCHDSHRYSLRRARRAGLEARVLASPSGERTAAFARLYDETMRRVDADPFYFLPRSLLENLLRLDGVFLVSADDAEGPMAMAVFLVGGEDFFYFLSASSPSALRHMPIALMHDEARRFALDRGLKRVHYGGGSESLQRFKSRLADSRVPYYVLRRIYDRESYERLVEANGCEDEAGFPAYQGLLFR